MMRLLALGTLAKEEMTVALRSRGVIFAWWGVAALAAAGAVIIGLISLHRFVADRFGPYWGDAAIGGLFIAIVIIALVAASVLAKRERRREHIKNTLLAAASVASEALPSRYSTMKVLMIAALAGGFWAARKK